MSTLTNFKALIQRPTLLQDIIDNVCCGGSVIDLAKTWEVRYCDLMRWINFDPDRKKQYYQALEDRGEYFVQRVLKEISDLAFRNSKDIYNEDHTLKPLSEWPEDVARSLQDIEVVELLDVTGKPIGKIKKIKMTDKLKAIEMLGKNQYMFTERKEVLHGDTNDPDFCDEFFGFGRKKQQGSPTTGEVQIL